MLYSLVDPASPPSSKLVRQPANAPLYPQPWSITPAAVCSRGHSTRAEALRERSIWTTLSSFGSVREEPTHQSPSSVAVAELDTVSPATSTAWVVAVGFPLEVGDAIRVADGLLATTTGSQSTCKRGKAASTSRTAILTPSCGRNGRRTALIWGLQTSFE